MIESGGGGGDDYEIEMGSIRIAATSCRFEFRVCAGERGP